MPRPIRPSIIDRDALLRVAACLFGTPLPANWQVTLARQLGHASDDGAGVKSWGRRNRPIHADAVRSLLALIDQRAEHLASIGEELSAALAAAGEAPYGGGADRDARSFPAA